MSLARGIAAIGAALVLSATSAQAQNTQIGGTITLVSYSGIFQDNYTAAVIAPFRKHYPNVTVNYAPGTTSAQMLGTARVQKTDAQVDVMIMDVTTSMIGNTEGIFAKLTPAEVPALNELYPEARAVGGEFGPAVTYDHLVIVYDTQNLKPGLTQLKELWRPDLKGQLAIYAPPNIQGLALTAMVEKMEGGDHTKSVDKAIAKLRDLAPGVQTFEPNPDGYSLILNGVVRVSSGWNARAQLYSDQSNGRIGVLLPPEGSVFQINTVNVMAASKNKAAALAFTNYALSQEAQKAFTERMFYAPTNAKAQIDPKALARTAAAPENRARMIPVDWTEIIKVRDQWNNRWRREIIAASNR